MRKEYPFTGGPLHGQRHEQDETATEAVHLEPGKPDTRYRKMVVNCGEYRGTEVFVSEDRNAWWYSQIN